MKADKLVIAGLWFLLIICALFVRIYGLSEYAFNDDELWHLTVANQKNIWQVIKYNFVEEIHPPLSYIIWHLMLQVSHNDLWLRMSSIIPGILLIPSIYLFGRLYIGEAAARFLALLFAFGSIPLTISTTIRAYSLMMLTLTWAAIFVHKYRFEQNVKSRRKFLSLYFLCSFFALELNHAACFVVFTLGLILIFQTIKEKNKKAFFLLAATHFIFAVLVAGYAEILKNYFGFNANLGYFTDSSFSSYLGYYLSMFLQFLLVGQPVNFFEAFIVLISFSAFFVAIFSLVRGRNWLLLHLILTPILAIAFCDYFLLYPFSPFLRNNLFLFLSFAVVYAYFVQIFVNYLPKTLTLRFKNYLVLKVLSVLLILSLTYFAYKKNFFRNLKEACLEFSVAKSDQDLLQKQLEQKVNPKNIFVTVMRNIWYYRFKYGENITIISKNLAKFENDKITIYFTAFPAREFSITFSALEIQLFFSDLFDYLKKNGDLKKVENFTFFDLGLKFEYFSNLLHPQMIEPKLKNFADTKHYKLWREAYEISWAINSSKEFKDKFYHRNIASACGREVIIMTFTPKFVEEQILKKNFINFKGDEEKIILRK